MGAGTLPGLLAGPLPRILDAQRRGEHHQLLGHRTRGTFQNHPAQAHIQRQLGQFTPDVGHRGRLVTTQCPKFAQQIHPVADRPGFGRLHKGERGHLRGRGHHPERNHLQDHTGQIGAANLRVGKFRTRVEILGGIQPDGDTLGDSATTARTLIRAGLRHPLNGQTLHLGAVRVPGNPGGPGIDHVLNPGHGQRGFGHIGGQDNARGRPGVEHPVLFGQGEAGEERQNLIVAQLAFATDHGSQRIRGIADFALAGEEDQNVSGVFHRQFADRITDRIQRVAFLAQLTRIGVLIAGGEFFLQGAVANLNREGAPGYLQNRGGDQLPVGIQRPKMRGKAFGVDGG